VPYHRYWITDEEIQEVVATLRSGWLTSGPRVTAFEAAFSELKGNVPAVALSSCTAGLFLALKSLNLQPGDEVITTPMTFVATANSIVHAGGEVVFADIVSDSMNISPAKIEAKIGPKTKAILPVHIGGNPCEMDQIMALAEAHDLKVIEDCAHSIEGEFEGKALGTFGYAGSYSFYPTKNITAAEGGMLTVQDEEIRHLISVMSRHGLDKGTFQRMEVEGKPFYDVLVPGFKANMTDLQAAIGLQQMKRLEPMYQRRVAIHEHYLKAFDTVDAVQIIRQNPKGKPSLHLFLLVLQPEVLACSRDEFLAAAREEGVELSVNYVPIHHFSWYRNRFCTVPGAYPVAEFIGANVISLPFYPAMKDEDVAYVVEILTQLCERFKR
ncbi:UNVERIFIED_CONTAM: hypothetical protein GTU68_057250, partial [Idotea baltica]|nr:hypothetical protein [Idotea baltica]